jgi:hypothetical protein
VYAWEYDDDDMRKAVAQLPPGARTALESLLEALVFDPADYGRRPDEPVDRAVRMLHFGLHGEGLATFVILERDLLVVVLRVTWLG